jgi:hypothetical protein
MYDILAQSFADIGRKKGVYSALAGKSLKKHGPDNAELRKRMISTQALLERANSLLTEAYDPPVKREAILNLQT